MTDDLGGIVHRIAAVLSMHAGLDELAALAVENVFMLADLGLG